MKAFMGLVGVLLLGSVAQAATSGTVTGRFTFYQNQGNYCPTTRDCTGVNYLQSQYQVYTGVPEAYVYVHDQAERFIGQGSTDTNGNFSIFWTAVTGTNVTSLKVYWQPRHKDGRFYIVDSNLNFYNFWTSTFTPVSSTGTTSVGTWFWGSSSSPHALSNVYDGAWMEWSRALAYSNRMLNYFSNLDIVAFSTKCVSSCTVSNKYGVVTIYLDPNSAYTPQARVTHEMGHAAGQFATVEFEQQNTSRYAGESYCWPTTDSSCTVNAGWQFNSPEWLSTAFEEGVATFIGDVAFNWYWATQPYTCNSASYCPTGVESASSLNEEWMQYGNCYSDEYRYPWSIIRYLWDVYDSPQDSAGIFADSIQKPYYFVFDTLNMYGTAFNTDRSNQEPFNSSNQLVAADQRNARDYSYWMWQTGLHSGRVMNGNCLGGTPRP